MLSRHFWRPVVGEQPVELLVGSRGLAEFRDVLEHLTLLTEVRAESPGLRAVARIVVGDDALDQRWFQPSVLPTVLLRTGAAGRPHFGQNVMHVFTREELPPLAGQAAALLRDLTIGDQIDPRRRLMNRLAELGDTSGETFRRALARIPQHVEERHAS